MLINKYRHKIKNLVEIKGSTNDRIENMREVLSL